MIEKSKGYSGIELILFLFILGIFITLMMWAITLEYAHFLVKENLWKKEPAFTITASMEDFNFISEDKYSSDKWSYIQLSNGDYLINPFESHLLCYSKTLPNNLSLLNEVSTKDMILFKQHFHSDTTFVVKKIALAWNDNQNMIERLQTCPDIDMSGQYIKYRGHDVVELVSLKKEQNKNTINPN
jgi:hypothetical protein